jgi:hypothetical protein
MDAKHKARAIQGGGVDEKVIINHADNGTNFVRGRV